MATRTLLELAADPTSLEEAFLDLLAQDNAITLARAERRVRALGESMRPALVSYALRCTARHTARCLAPYTLGSAAAGRASG